jgi:hypothetical protein
MAMSGGQFGADKLFTLVNDIINLPEWDEGDCKQIQNHFNELLQAGLYPNAPENDKSRFYEDNSQFSLLFSSQLNSLHGENIGHKE